MQDLFILKVAPFIAAAIAIELTFLFWHHKLPRYYSWKESLASLGVFLGYVASGSISKIFLVGLSILHTAFFSLWIWDKCPEEIGTNITGMITGV